MKSYPYTSVVTYDSSGNPIYDRAVDASFLRKFFKKDRSTGVLMLDDSSAFLVEKGESSWDLKINPGYCFINGVYGVQEDSVSQTLSSASSTLSRIDTIVLRRDDNTDVRAITIEVKQGTPASNPTRPSLTRTSLVYELGLADILIPAAGTEIKTENITDTRYDKTRCGVSLPLQEIDTTELYNQLQDQVESNKALIQSALDSTTAGYLQNQLDALKTKFGYLTGIGRFYTTMGDEDPTDLFGGTWVKVQDRMLLASGTRSAGDTGGEETHTLTVSELPSHTHSAKGVNTGASSTSRMGSYPFQIYQDHLSNWDIRDQNSKSFIGETGSGVGHNNLPPYLVVNIWYRTA